MEQKEIRQKHRYKVLGSNKIIDPERDIVFIGTNTLIFDPYPVINCESLDNYTLYEVYVIEPQTRLISPCKRQAQITGHRRANIH